MNRVFLISFICAAICDARGSSIVYKYDGLHRISSVQYSNGSRVEYYYDTFGNRKTYLATATASRKSENLLLANGQIQYLQILNSGSAGASYDWYRDGVKLTTTSEPRLGATAMTPDRAGAYRVVIREASGAVSVVELLAQLKGLDYESWLTHAVGPAADPADPGLGRSDSALGDGVSNILKYAMGKGPQESAHADLPKPAFIDTPQGKRFGIKLSRILDPADVSITIQGSSDLKNWKDVTGELETWGNPVPSADGLAEIIELMAPYPISDARAGAYRYLRLAVSELRAPRFGVFATAIGTVGGSLTLTLPMAGEPATGFDWYRGDVMIGQTTVPQFVILDFSVNSAGLYRVVARNAYGSTNSQPFLVRATGWTYEKWLTSMVGQTITPQTPGYGYAESKAGDGVSNLIKYVIGKPPQQPGGTHMPKGVLLDTPQGRRHGIQVTGLDPLDVSVRIEGAPDLKTWTDVTYQLSLWNTTQSPDGLTDTLTLLSPYPITDARAAAHRYLRLAVTSLNGPKFDATTTHSGMTGQAMVLTVPVSGEPPSSFDWYLNGHNKGQTAVPQFPINPLTAASAGTWHAIAHSGYGDTTSTPFVVQVGGLTYGDWLTAKVGGGVTPASPGYARGGIPMADGFSNVFKYAFATVPQAAVQPKLPAAKLATVGGARYPVIEFDRLLSPSEVQMRIEASGDLLAWRDVTGQMVPHNTPVPSPDGLSERVTFRCPVSLAQAEAKDWKFLRVAVTDLMAPSPTVLISDDFNDGSIDTAKWTVSGNTVTETGQIMKVLATVTDQWGTLTSKPIPLASSGTVTLTRSVRLHDEPRNNKHYFMANTRLNFGTLAPVVIRYYNMDYEAPPNYKAVHGIYICRNNANPHNPNYAGYNPSDVSSWISPLWDTWFKETIVYNPQSGNLAYSVNDVLQTTFNVGVMPATASPSLVLSFDPAAWWTGHEHLIDNLQVIQNQ